MAFTSGDAQVLGADRRQELERILASSIEPRATAHFLVLNLPLPCIDALGRPAWSTRPTEVSKAYRNLSRLVHPDKIQEQDLKTKARDAFEAVKAAYTELSNEDTLEEVLRAYAVLAKERGDLEHRHTDKTLEEKVDAMGKELDERKRLREEEYVSMTDEIQRQLEEKRRRALLVKKKREEKELATAWDGVNGFHARERGGREGAGWGREHPVRGDHDGDDGDDGDDDDDGDDGDDDDEGARRRRRQQNRRRERSR